MKVILNGTEVTPKDYENIGLAIDYTDPIAVVSVTVDTITFVNEAIEVIENHKNTLGLTEGIPLQFILANGKVLNYYVDLMDGALFSDKEIKVKIKRRYSSEIFQTQARAYSFEYLAKIGVDFNSTAVQTPYLIIKNNQLEQGLSLSITLYMMSDALYTAIKDTVFMIQEFIQAVDLAPGHLIGAIGKLIAQIAYTVALIVAVIKLAQELRNLLLPKIRYFFANSLRELIRLGVEQLGYQLQSTLLDNISTFSVIGVPLIKNKENIWDILENDLNFAFNKPYPTASDTIPTLMSAIESVITMCNAKLHVYEDATGQPIVRIERRDFNYNTYNASLTPALTLQDTRINQWQYNTNEIWKRRYYAFIVDNTDFHTMNDFNALDCEDSTEQIVIQNPDLVSIKNNDPIPFMYSLGSRKNNLNWIENRLQDLFGFIDDVVNALGGSSNLVQNINDRIGCLQIENQFFVNTKLVVLFGDAKIKRIPENHQSLLSARVIEQNYHAIDFIGVNDFKVIESEQLNISTDDFSSLEISNYAEINGQNCELLRVEFLDEKLVAKVTYKEPDNWAFNCQKLLIN